MPMGSTFANPAKDWKIFMPL